MKWAIIISVLTARNSATQLRLKKMERQTEILIPNKNKNKNKKSLHYKKPAKKRDATTINTIAYEKPRRSSSRLNKVQKES